MLNTNINGLHFKGTIETLPGAYPDYYTNIYDVIRNGKQLIVKPEEALNVIKIIEAVYESSKLKKAIEVILYKFRNIVPFRRSQP